MADKHTPPPWRFEDGQPNDHGPDGGGGFTILMGQRQRTGSGRFIHIIGYAADVYREDGEWSEAEANAAVIVRAVNRDHLFGELVEALEEISHYSAASLRLGENLNAIDRIVRAVLAKVEASDA